MIIPGGSAKLVKVRTEGNWKGQGFVESLPLAIVRKIAPALVEVIAIYENGKTRIVNIDVLKEFRGENHNHGYTSDPSHPEVGGGDEMSEIPSIQHDPQLQRNLISIPARGEYPTNPPPR